MEKNQNNFYNLIPGFLLGFTRVITSHPFDYIRLYMQTNKHINIKNEIKNFNIYRGSLLPILTTPLERAISFYGYEYLKKNKYSDIKCAIYPSLFSSFYMTPINVINSSYIFNKELSLKNIFKQEIKKNIYRGNVVELFRNSLSTFLFLYIYNLKLSKNSPFINGILASSIMWTAVYPLDTIKTQKFIYNKSYKEILKNTKFLNYYNGISLVYLRSIPSVGVGMIVYENTKKYLNL